MNLEGLKHYLGAFSARDFFRHARARYLEQESVHESLDSLLSKIAQQLGTNPESVWATQHFQMLFRATRPEDLRILGLDQHAAEAETAVQAGRVMSLLPYNAVMGETTIRKFIPSRPEKFSGPWKHSMDPYGIFRSMDRVVAIDDDGNETYLATRKFSYAVLANIIEACNIGCDGCYKGSMVRTSLSSLAEISPEYAEIKKQLNLQEERAEKQAELLTRWLNKNPEVNTIVISGGEPTLFSNHGLEKILEQYKHATHVKVVRMCTSSVFQGLWYRIDDELAHMLLKFEEETGKQFYINAHVTDDHQLLAPEAKMAVDKLQRAGISIHLQMPLQEGINFRRDDLPWSVDLLRRISKAAYELGVVPYKMIVDMHSPSERDLTVPIETVSRAIGFLDQHELHSDHERWQAYNVLHKQGNFYLYPYPHFVAVKEIDQEHQRVRYFIPKIECGSSKRIVVHTYEEPIVAGHNDNPNSLNRIQDHDVITRINHVRQGYAAFCSQDLSVRDFYVLSGINYPENKPILI